MALKIGITAEAKRVKNTHYTVQVKGRYSHYLCRGFSTFGKHRQDLTREVNCKLCNSIFRGRSLAVYKDMEE